MACFRLFAGLLLTTAVTMVMTVALPITPALAQDPAQPDQQDEGANGGGSMLEQLDREVTALADRARKSVVKITAYTRLPMPHPEVIPEGQPREVVIPVTYSGLVARKDGFIVTVADAVDRANEFEVDLPDGRRVKGEVWATDERTNLAILKVELKDGDELTPARLANGERTARLRPGQFLMSCGNPFGLERSVATGIVTGIDRTIIIDGHAYFGVIQTNATINPGDPGGAAVASDGQVVGMIWSTYGRSRFDSSAPNPGGPGMMGGVSENDVESFRKLLEMLMPGVGRGNNDGGQSPDDGSDGQVDGGEDNDGNDGDANGDGSELDRTREEWQRRWKQWQNEYYRQMAAQKEREVFLSAQGINFILPASLVKHVAEQLIEHRRVPRATLGVLLRQFSAPNGYTSVMVLHVEPGTPAHSAGIERGDLLIKLDDDSISTMADVQRVMQTARVGHALRVVIKRQGKVITLETVLAEKRND